MPFCRTSFQINRFLPLEAHCCRLRIFCLTDSWKNITKFCVLVLGPRPIGHDLGGITFRKKGKGLCFRRMLWISSLYTFTSSLFLILGIGSIYRVNSNYCFRPRWKPLRARVGDCCLKSFKEKQIILQSQLPKKYTADCSIIASFLWFLQNVWVVSCRR